MVPFEAAALPAGVRKAFCGHFILGAKAVAGPHHLAEPSRTAPVGAAGEGAGPALAVSLWEPLLSQGPRQRSHAFARCCWAQH